MLDLHRLRVFRAVIATGSINGAATTLGFTASAVSQHVTALQKETGLALLERQGRGVVPTAAGLTLADRAGDVLSHLAELESMTGDLRAGRVGSLTIGYFASAAAAWIPPIIGTLSREFPLLRFDLRLIELRGNEPYSPDLEVAVAEADGTDPTPRPGEGTTLLLEDPYVVVLPLHHPLARRDSIRLVELRDEPWVDNDFSRGPCRQVILDACASIGITPSFRVETHDHQTAIAFVASGAGITVLPRLGAADLRSGVVAIPVVEPTPTRRILLRVKRSVARHPAIVRAVEMLEVAASSSQ